MKKKVNRTRTKLDMLRNVEELINNSNEPLDAGKISKILKTNWVSVRDCCEYLREKGMVDAKPITSYQYFKKRKIVENQQ